MSRGRRFTPRDNVRISEWYAAYMPVPKIADRLGRSVGAIRQRVLALKLYRDHGVSSCLKWAPDHLRARVLEMDPKAFRDMCFAWRREQWDMQRADRAAEKERRVAQACAAIDRSLDRDAKICAMRQAGMTLEAIGQRCGLTRERVRQLTTPGWPPATLANRNRKLRARRNKEIRAKWLAGVSRQNIAKQHGLTVSRVYQLTVSEEGE